MAAKDTPSVNLSTLPIPQLTSIKNQLTQELQHLTSSFTQLRAAQAKFRDCINSIRDGIEEGGREDETVLVDVGTGFYLEKTPPDARQFYTSKVDDLGKNLKDLEKIVQGKQGNLNIVEDVLRQRMMSESTGSVQDAKGGGGNG
ncbi:MAG: hypothetical protein LQ346_001849 [Caloplaca aetnensis]|nr:MAG: hypothetical protein LQ346_001849 [Caloplaca aetnensis]